MWIPSIFVGFVLGILFVIVPVSFYEILLNYAAIEEQKKEDEKIKTKGWIKKGWHNMIRDIKKKFKKKDQVVKPKKKLTKKQAQAKLKKMFK